MVNEFVPKGIDELRNVSKAFFHRFRDCFTVLFLLFQNVHIYKDMAALEKSIDKNDEEASPLDSFSLEMFENIAYIMAKHADPTIPDTVEDWLDEFNTFSIYQVLPELIDLWGMNVATQAESKKKYVPSTGK